MLEIEKLNKNYDEMLNNAIDKLKRKTQLNDFSAGSVARSLLEVYIDEMDKLYDKLPLSVLMKFVSQASGPYLDEIGKLVNKERKDNESDDNFRYRIIHATEEYAKANQYAIKMPLLNIDGVYNVELKRFTRGTGSFDVYVVTDDPLGSEDIFEQAQEIIEEQEAFGIDGKVLKPDLVYIDLDIIVTFNNNADDKSNIKNTIESKITKYLTNIYFEDQLIITDLITTIKNISPEQIKDVNIQNMFIDEERVSISNKTLNWDEQLVPQNININ